MARPESLRGLIEQGYLYPAKLPKKNDFLFGFKEEGESSFDRDKGLDSLNLEKLSSLDGYMVFLTEKDYGALSPLMWNSLFERMGKNYRAIYFVADPSKAVDVVYGLKKDPKLVGGGFGSGWKEKHVYLDRVVPEGLKSANFFVKNSDGELVGYNTDIEGMILPLEDLLRERGLGSLEGKRVVVLGAGGVGKELPRYLVEKGVGKIVILNRTVEKAEGIAEELNSLKENVAEYGDEDDIGIYFSKGVDVVINVTKKGAEPLERYSAFAPIFDSEVRGGEVAMENAMKLVNANPDAVVYDITLPKSGFPKTLEIAKKAGLENLLDGVGMVVNQGVIGASKLAREYPSIFDGFSIDFVKSVFEEVTK